MSGNPIATGHVVVAQGVHAGEDGETPRRRHGELALVAETGGIGFVGG